MRLPVSERTILELLATRDAGYGLELVTESQGRLTRGGIYVTLGRMEQKGLVTSESSEGGRRLYRATGLGERTRGTAAPVTERQRARVFPQGRRHRPSW